MKKFGIFLIAAVLCLVAADRASAASATTVCTIRVMPLAPQTHYQMPQTPAQQLLNRLFRPFDGQLACRLFHPFGGQLACRLQAAIPHPFRCRR